MNGGQPALGELPQVSVSQNQNKEVLLKSPTLMNRAIEGNMEVRFTVLVREF